MRTRAETSRIKVCVSGPASADGVLVMPAGSAEREVELLREAAARAGCAVLVVRDRG